MSFLPLNGLTTLHVLAATTTTTKKTSSSGSLSFLVILLLLLAGYFLFIRPRQQRLRQAQAQQRQADIGDEVVTTGGVVGRVRAMTDERVTLEVAPGTTIEVLKQAIARRIDPPAYDPPPSGYAAPGELPHDGDEPPEPGSASWPGEPGGPS